MKPDHYWLTTQRLTKEMGYPVTLSRPPINIQLQRAEQEKQGEIRSLEMELNPPGLQALDRRRKIWDDLIRADTYAALRKACGRWAQLADVRSSGTTPYPRHIVRNAAVFLLMKKNGRFPRSPYGDDARVDYLARGMAGVLCDLSPMTGIERLRNMQHDRAGPLWVTREGNRELPERERYCGCWRCKIEKSSKLTEYMRSGYDNGLKAFIELATTTKVPMEWRMRRSRLV